MRFDPDRHHRRSIRLRGYDYAQAGAYFVTVCEIHRECIFGDVHDEEMCLNPLGEIADECWIALAQHFPHVELDKYVIMPNHVHGIFVITEAVVGARHASPRTNATDRATHASPLQTNLPRGPHSGSVGAIVGSYKSAVSKRINVVRGTQGNSAFQRDYYEHIIRNEREWNAMAAYIRDNPRNWSDDLDNPANGARVLPNTPTPHD
jgi:REP element-mobilizing transposase RayT